MNEVTPISSCTRRRYARRRRVEAGPIPAELEQELAISGELLYPIPHSLSHQGLSLHHLLDILAQFWGVSKAWS